MEELRRELAEAREQRAATAAILAAISNSTTDPSSERAQPASATPATSAKLSIGCTPTGISPKASARADRVVAQASQNLHIRRHHTCPFHVPLKWCNLTQYPRDDVLKSQFFCGSADVGSFCHSVLTILDVLR